DIDFVVDLKLEAVKQLSESFEADFHIDEEAALEAVRHRDMFNIIHRQTTYKADLHMLPEGEWGAVQMQRRVWFPPTQDPASKPVPFASPEDTVIAKLRWYKMTGERSDKQWGDLLGVLRQQ